METTTKQILIIEDSQFYLLTPAGRQHITKEEANSLKQGYVMFLPDSEFYYATMEFPDAPKRKLNLFISNYLMATLLSAHCEYFSYLKKGDKILIGIFRADFIEFYNENSELFKKASVITSPFANLFAKHDNFSYRNGEFSIEVNDGLIEHVTDVEETAEKDYHADISSRLAIPFAKAYAGKFDAFKIPAAILVACYLLFFAGEYFRYKTVKKQQTTAEIVLNDIYKKAKVADKRDPYGHLLFLANKNESSAGYKSIFVIEKMSKAHNENITTDSIEIKGSNVVSSGKAKDFSFLEEYKKKLAEETKSEVKIIDTEKKDDLVHFTVRFEV
jgi:hypothetical protein